MANFFTKTLGIPNCNWEYLVEEIREFKASDGADFDRISALYSCLASECREGNIVDKLK
jgi:hypothetical protein